MSVESTFVARESELAQLQSFLDHALAGQGQVVFATGEAGAGKTTLVTEFARRAQAAHPDLIVALGQGDAQTGVGDAYLPFREVLALLTGDVEGKLADNAIDAENVSRLRSLLSSSGQILVDLGPDLIDVLVPGAGLVARVGGLVAQRAGWAPELERLAQRRAEAETPASGADCAEQENIFDQYTAVLQRLAGQRQLILIIDDLQWADTSSIRLLFRLSRRIGSSRILLIGTYRPNDVAMGRDGERHPLESVVNELKRYGGGIEISLEQELRGTQRDLGEPGDPAYEFVHAYIDAVYSPHAIDDAFIRQIAERTDGHPLFVVELLRDLQERSWIVQAPLDSPAAESAWVLTHLIDFTRLPTRVEAVIAERIGRLEADLRETLSVASVEGQEFTAQAVAQLRQINERGLVTRLAQELDKQHHLVGSSGVARVGARPLFLYRFRHALFRRYVYDSLSEPERMLLHGEVGEALEALYGEHAADIAPQLARHFDEAGDVVRAAKYHALATETACRGHAYDEALQHCDAAVAACEACSPDEPELQAQLHQAHETRGRILQALGD